MIETNETMKGTSTERQKYIHHEHDTPCAVDEEGIKRDAESLKKLRAVMVRDNTLFASFVTFNKRNCGPESLCNVSL